MKRHFYDLGSGRFVGSFEGKDDDAEANTPAGVGVLLTEEPIDHTAQRVDLQTGALVDHVPAPDPDEILAERARASRYARLALCDWVIVRAVEQGEPMPEAWRAYRQALRDVTRQAGFPGQIVWPEPPA